MILANLGWLNSLLELNILAESALNILGATGLDLTGLVADVYMLWWDGRFRDKLKDLSFPLDLYKRFKDDINTISDPLPLGTRYCPKNNELQYETLLYRKIYQNQFLQKRMQQEVGSS